MLVSSMLAVLPWNPDLGKYLSLRMGASCLDILEIYFQYTLYMCRCK